jgi:hypothetical protein
VNAALTHDAVHIAEFLSTFQTADGIQDPDEHAVMSHAYTTDFYAWLAALLYRDGHGAAWLTRSLTAIRAAVAQRSAEHSRKQAPPPAPQFHWEFKNIALLQTWRLLAHDIPTDLRTQLGHDLRTWRDLNVLSTNWGAMRAVAYAERYRSLHHPLDWCRSRLEIALVLQSQTADGFFPDTPHSYSFQYHAYVLALLALYQRIQPDSRVRASFLRGVAVLADFIDPDGDFNYYGRGQAQIFGYASLVLALREAAQLCGHTSSGRRYFDLARRVAQFVRRFRRPDQTFPLVLHAQDSRLGWYDYNLRGDYLAFLGVFYLLAAALPELDAPDPLPAAPYARCYPDLGLAVVATPRQFAAFATRSDDLAEPLGLLHSWPQGVGYFGGPEQKRARGVDYSLNYFGLLVAGQPVLQRCQGTMSCEEHRLHLLFTVSDLHIEQAWQWDNGLQLVCRTRSLHDTLPALQAAIAAEQAPASEPPLALEESCPTPIGARPRFVSGILQAGSEVVWSVQLPLSPGADLRACMIESAPVVLQVVRHPRRRLRPRAAAIRRRAWQLWVILDSWRR